MTSGQTEQGTMRAWRTHQYGPRPTEVLQLDSVPIPEPQPGEVRVRVQAIPLNLNDLERITGGNMMVQPELPYSPGMEVMGVVDACGPGAEAWQGRRVVAVPRGANGGFAEYAVCPVVTAFDMPAEIPLPDAAALYFPFHLAWLGLFDRADLRAGESVLIHAGAGGSGSAAIQLAVDKGARVFATAGSAEKVALCRELGAQVAIDYTETDFAQLVLDATEGRGVDVVFDNVGAAVMEKSMGCLAYNGRYLMMGFASDKKVADEKLVVPRRIALGNFKLCGVQPDRPRRAHRREQRHRRGDPGQRVLQRLRRQRTQQRQWHRQLHRHQGLERRRRHQPRQRAHHRAPQRVPELARLGRIELRAGRRGRTPLPRGARRAGREQPLPR